jgi:hypothetical protein
MTSAAPREFAQQLARLSPGLTIVVPNDLLLRWFPPAHRDQTPDEVCKSAAQAFASRFGCVFHYFPLGGDCEQGDGRFHKVRAPGHASDTPPATNRQSPA